MWLLSHLNSSRRLLSLRIDGFHRSQIKISTRVESKRWMKNRNCLAASLARYRWKAVAQAKESVCEPSARSAVRKWQQWQNHRQLFVEMTRCALCDLGLLGTCCWGIVFISQVIGDRSDDYKCATFPQFNRDGRRLKSLNFQNQITRIFISEWNRKYNNFTRNKPHKNVWVWRLIFYI